MAEPLKYVQLEVEIEGGQLVNDPTVLVDGEPVGKLPASDVRLDFKSHRGPGVWLLEVPAEDQPTGRATLRTLKV